MAKIVGGNNPHNSAHVQTDGLLMTRAVRFAEQRWASDVKESAFQVEYEMAIGGTGTTYTILYLENNSNSKVLVGTYMRVQAFHTTGTPDENDLFTFLKNPTYTSGGDDATPVNMNFGSSVTADVVAKQNNPTISGGTQFDRYGAYSNGMQTYNKEGSVIIPKGKALAIQYTSGAGVSAGTAWARISFLQVVPYATEISV